MTDSMEVRLFNASRERNRAVEERDFERSQCARLARIADALEAKMVRATVLVDEFKRRADEADRRDEPNAYARRVVWDRAAEMLRDALKDKP